MDTNEELRDAWTVIKKVATSSTISVASRATMLTKIDIVHNALRTQLGDTIPTEPPTADLFREQEDADLGKVVSENTPDSPHWGRLGGKQLRPGPRRGNDYNPLGPIKNPVKHS